ncbi:MULTISPECIES: methionine--tRNA ligase [unclassified Robiginitalea]|uniref:methionine--tRNA ligase n=1 Tax=Robiginitalea TaxID=252306 RepID=UPI00234AC7FF|nr:MULTISPECIES: methionine--tRNA ligase [unclassified Robiginitalea]MDC6353467.1 methionine--tRNA ligase [Robiginitalea sp. PM2]MDC6373368.1 methionine--tRNA ligase [Robiginitalea sp. SP8]
MSDAKGSFERTTITAALPYTNGPIHIGHLAGVYVPADIYSRYLRLRGEEVLFVCGSDEHGVAIPMKAGREGISPKELIDKYDALIRESFEAFGIAFDNYSRTSAPIHRETASAFFTKLHDQGDFEEQVTDQLFDPEAGQFLADRFVVGTCPKCGHTEAYGDQCENCGSSLNATDLIDPRSAISGAQPVLKQTRHWFLPLDRYEDFLRTWILDGHKNDWKPNVYGQCKSWIDEGLKPRAVTRDLEWGIPVPLEGAEGKVLYVWFDAPIGYISSTREWARREGADWEIWWKDPGTRLLHFIGKDNIVFHCIIFPSMLKAHGDFILPENVPANEFLNLEGQKLSTSKNWAVWLHEYLEEFPDMQDVLRYALTANAPETKDNDFTWKDFQARNNNELVAIFGNFINRVAVLTDKYKGGQVPALQNLSENDRNTLHAMRAYPARIADCLDRFRFREGSQELMNLARLGNKYLADEEPWKVIKEDPDRVGTILGVGLQVAAALAVLCEPFLPFTAGRLREILNLGTLDSPLEWEAVSREAVLLPAGHAIGETRLLFRKIEDAEIEKQLQKLHETKKQNEMDNSSVTPQKDTIQYDDFTKLDLRVGTILEAEKMPKADKLIVMKVDTGIDTRTIVSGIAKQFAPEDLVGKQVTVLVNLAPRPLRGVESQGMILLAEDAEGNLVFLTPEQALANGSVIS